MNPNQTDKLNEQAAKDIIEYLIQKHTEYQELEYVGHVGDVLILKAKCSHKQVALKIAECINNSEDIELMRKENEILSQLKNSVYFVSVNKYFYLVNDNEEEGEEIQQSKYFIIDMDWNQPYLNQLLGIKKAKKEEEDAFLDTNQIFSHHANKKVEQLSTKQDPIQSQLLKSSSLIKEKSESEIALLQNQMYLTSSEIKKIEQARHNQISARQINSAIQILYEKKSFSLFSYLSSGSSGVMFSAQNIISKRESLIQLCLLTNKNEILRQVSVMKKCYSPYILEFYGYELFEDENESEYVVFEFEKCQYSLIDYLDQHKEEISHNTDLKMSIALQILDSVNIFHLQDILHGDITLENFLVREDSSSKITIKLTGFNQADFLQSFLSYDSEEQLTYKNDQDTSVNCIYMRGKSGTPAYLSPERTLTKEFPSTFVSDSYSVGLCLLLLDNYSQFYPIFMENYLELLQPHSVPFMKCHHLFNKESLIYKWAISLLTYFPSSRLLLREIIDQIEDPITPLYSKFKRTIPFQESVQVPSCLFLKDFEYSNIIQLLNQKESNIKQLYLSENDTFSSEDIISLSAVLSKMNWLSSLTLNLNRSNIRRSSMRLFSLGLSQLSQLSSLTLDLSRNQMTKEDVMTFSLGLQKLNQLSSLKINLSRNEMSSEGLTQLAQGLFKLNQLSSLALDLSGNQLTSESVNCLFLNISKLEELLSLTLNLSRNSISLENEIAFPSSLSKFNQFLNLSIDLFGNRIQSEGVMLLSSSLSLLNSLSSLTLNLSWNDRITSEGYSALSSGLSKLYQLLSLTLLLSKNGISSEGIISLSQGLSNLKELSSLNLSLSQNDQISSEGYISLSSSISQLNQLSSLSLDLSQNQIASEGVISFSKGISQLKKLFTFTLNLSYNNHITGEGYKQLLSDISKLISLSSLILHLTQNQITNEAVKPLSSSLALLNQLQSFTLFFSWNDQIKNEGYINLSEGLSKLNQLSSLTLDLSENKITSECMVSLSLGLSKLSQLSSLILKLTGNQITTESLWVCFSKLSNLQNLSLQIFANVQITQDKREELEDLIKSNNSQMKYKIF